MATFRIPKEDLTALYMFFSLEDNIDSIIEIFNSDIDSDDELSKIINEKFNIEINIALDLLYAVSKLLLSKNSSDLCEDDFIDEIKDSLLLEDDFNFKGLSDISINLKKLLNVDGSFFVRIKANQLVFDRDKILTRSRILTDVRSIFNEKVDFDIVSNAVMHNLKINYLKNKKKRKIYLALDRFDLISLRENIERALKKEEKIKDYFKASGLNIIEH